MHQIIKLVIPTLFFATIAMTISAQPWVDKVYNTNTEKDIIYGEALDYAGTMRSLQMDIAYPTNDVPPECGRPLVLIIHGGAWLGGRKDEGYVVSMLSDFAQRGYVSASINYRLGIFQTEKEVNCNISGIAGLQWNCLNMSDTLEWARAWYRAVQDSKGALRYLMTQSETYQIDRRNVFVVGESAGAFTALGVVYLDDPSEKPAACSAINPVLPPNQIYENPCIVNPGFATDIDNMDLSRPDLGSIQGTLYPDAPAFTIKACGDFYGGLLTDLFSVHAPGNIPALYMYHQPADLVVPINYQLLFAGYSACASSIGNCQSIYGRPHTYGSDGIKAILDNLTASGAGTPEYLYDRTTNNASCLEQIINPAVTGHAIDNYGLRTGNMAAFFASKIESGGICLSGVTSPGVTASVQVSPNPADSWISFPTEAVGDKYWISRYTGEKVRQGTIPEDARISISDLTSGIYLIFILKGSAILNTKFLKI